MSAQRIGKPIADPMECLFAADAPHDQIQCFHDLQRVAVSEIQGHLSVGRNCPSVGRIPFLENCLQVRVNRMEHVVYTAPQLTGMQKIITLVVFAGFSTGISAT